MKTCTLSALLLIILIAACKKEKKDPPAPTPTPSADTTRPIITLKGKINDTINLGSYTDPGAIATDNKDGDITPFIVVTSSVTANQNVYYFSPKGTYYINYDVRDGAGNRATITRTIHVINAMDFMTGTYSAACTCTATDLSQSPSTTVTTTNYTATVIASTSYNNSFELSALNTGVKTVSVNAVVGGNSINFQPPPSGVSGGSIINNNSFMTETIDKGSGPDFHCVNIYTRQ
jgi:hypothetical protein